MLYYKNKSDCFSRLISDGYFRTFVISGQAWYCDRLASEQLTKFSVTQRNFPLLIYKILNYALSAEIIFYILKQIVQLPSNVHLFRLELLNSKTDSNRL